MKVCLINKILEELNKLESTDIFCLYRQSTRHISGQTFSSFSPRSWPLGINLVNDTEQVKTSDIGKEEL